MDAGTRVKVKILAELPEDQLQFRGRVGVVDEITDPPGTILVQFAGEQGLQQFHADVLEVVV